MFFSLLVIQLLTMYNMVNVKAAPFSTSPFFHIPLDHGGLTILVCVVNDVLHREGGMAWLSKSTSSSNPALYNILGKEDAQNAVSVRSLVSTEWDTYTCFISHRSTIHVKAGHYYGLRKSRIGKSTAHHLKLCPIAILIMATWNTHVLSTKVFPTLSEHTLSFWSFNVLGFSL